MSADLDCALWWFALMATAWLFTKTVGEWRKILDGRN